MKIRFITILIALLVINKANAISNYMAIIKEQVLETKIIEGRLYIHVKLNEKLTGYMLFDNGASRCVIYKQHLNNLGLKITGEVKVSLASGESGIPITEDIDLNLSGLVSKIPSAYVIEITHNDICENIIGTIGSNLIDQFNWSIDLSKNEVKIKSEKYYDAKARYLTYPEIEGKSIYLQGQILNDNVYFFVDFGYDGELLIPSKHRREMGLFSKENKGYRFIGNLGIPVINNVPNTIEVITVNYISLGGLNIKNVNATVGNFNKFNLGTKILSNYKIHLNCGERTIGFISLKSTPVEMLPNQDFGLDFNYSTDDKKILVNRIFEHYEDKKDFHIGQIVDKINGKSVSDFSNDCEINKYILKCRSKKSFQITIKNKTYTLIKEKVPQIAIK